jgi:membrane protein YdbS with pleckstrin-like domain
MRQVSPAASVPASVNRYLLPQERSVITVRMHPAVLARPLILASGLVSGGLVAARKLTGRPVRREVVWGAPLSVLLYFLYRVAAWRVAYFVVTNKRMILISGLVVRKVAMMPLARVTDMSFQRSAMGRVFGYGEFIVESAEEQALRSVNFLPYPEQLYLEVCGLLFPDAVAEAQQDQDHLPDSPG